MKTVVNSSQVAHLWANKAQSEARNGKGSFYFRDSIIFSYRDSFPIAKHVTNKKGQTAVLFTTRTYSITTSGHCSKVRSAINRSKTEHIFNVDDVLSNEHAKQLKEYQDEVNQLFVKVQRARSNKEWKLRTLREKIDEANTFAEFFGFKGRVKEPDAEWYTEQQRLAKEQAEKDRIARETRERAEANQRARQREIEAADFRYWLEGQNVRFPHSYSRRFYAYGNENRDGVTDTDYMRVKGDTVETSQGAEVPREHVERIAPLVVRIVTNGETYKANGHTIHVGHFTLDKIDEAGNVFVGCHLFSKAEILRFAAVLGVYYAE